MDGATLLLVISGMGVSGVGVGFGWQPMPDGSQRYEYVVQVEPELAATLARGHAIPIVAEIPDEVQPIGRIRLVVGREDLPRQRLVTHLKPAIDGVQLAQHNQYADPRYSSTPAQQAPASSWNSQSDPSITPTETDPPSSQQLFGQQQHTGDDTWNNGAATHAVADAAAGAFDRVGEGMQRAVAPVKNGLEQVDSQVRGVVGELGDRTRGIVDELRQPFNPQPQLPANNRLPAAVGASGGEAQAWNQDPAASATENPLRNNSAPAGSSWNNEPPTTPPFVSSPAGAPPSNVGSSAGTEWNNGTSATAAADPRNGNTGRTPGTASGDPWAGVPDPRNQAGASQIGNPTDAPGLATRPMPFGGVGADPQTPGPTFPTLGNPPAPVNQPGNTPSLSPSAPATVASNMLKQPADRPLDETPLGQPAAAIATGPALTIPNGQATATARPWNGTQPAGAATTAANLAGTASAAAATQPAGRDNTVAVLVAWVLLTGSIAGNMYLFWSYLDVRQKYRSLVRKTARAVGSRFSAA